MFFWNVFNFYFSRIVMWIYESRWSINVYLKLKKWRITKFVVAFAHQFYVFTLKSSDAAFNNDASSSDIGMSSSLPFILGLVTCRPVILSSKRDILKICNEKWSSSGISLYFHGPFQPSPVISSLSLASSLKFV